MSGLIPLHFDSFDVRMILRDGVPWWVLADVCRVVGIKNHRDAATRLYDWQKDDVGISDAIGRQQKTLVVNEAGIYGLVIGSNKPEAEAFARWLFAEVLPSIRKYGKYPPPPVADLVDQSRWQGMGQTMAERFREERMLWEERHARAFAGSVPGFSKNVVQAIERGAGKILTLERLHMLTLAEVDVLYILTGRRRFSLAEHRLIDQVRTALPPSDQQ